MKNWVVANQKGGVGKTTTAVTLAGLLADQGHNVLVVDLDPHASITQYFDIALDSLQQTIFDAFIVDQLDKQFITDTIVDTTVDSIKLLPANIALATLDKKYGTRKGLGLRLKQILALVESDYDYAVIDCPPVLGVLMINALAAAQNLIIPVQTEFLAIKGLERMLETIAMVFKQPQSRPQTVIVPTMYDKRTRASVDSLRHLRQTYEDTVWRSIISIDTHFRDASQNHQVPSRYIPESRGVFEYKQLCKDILNGSINRFVNIQEAV